MVRKKRKRDVEQPPWCYYCDRVFSDESTLIQHQKAKHFKCTTCHRKLTSASGLRVHCHQVHRFTLDKVPAAIPGRDSIELEVFGMSGVPEGATPGLPLPNEDEPPNNDPGHNALVPGSLPSLAPQPQSSLQPRGMPVPVMHPPPATPADLPSSGFGCPPHVMVPHPFPDRHTFLPTLWRPPPFLNGPPLMPGPYSQQPAFPIGVSPHMNPPPPVTTLPALPLFPIGTDHNQGTLNGGKRDVNSTLQATGDTALAKPIELGGVEGSPSYPAIDISVEELRSKHAKYMSKGASLHAI